LFPASLQGAGQAPDEGLADETVVPTARLELAQLSPLPPQDSVSTNFTTSARVALFSEPFSLLEVCSLNSLGF
jgi:hypothetical protein